MKRILILSLFFMFYSSLMKADNCSEALKILQSAGFNFNSIGPDENAPHVTLCGRVDGTKNMVHIKWNPARIFVFNEFSTINGYCVKLNGSYSKTTYQGC